MMPLEITLTLPVTIRPAQAEDILKLEWFGIITPFREILQKDFAASQAGKLVYLVAEANHLWSQSGLCKNH